MKILQNAIKKDSMFLAKFLTIAILILCAGLVIPVKAEETGSIISPTGERPVSEELFVRGAIYNLSSDKNLWIAVRKGRLMWPKEPEVQAVGESWSVVVYEGGTPSGGSFQLVLLSVDQTGDAKIREWIRVGKATGSFPGLRLIPGAKELDSVVLRMR